MSLQFEQGDNHLKNIEKFRYIVGYTITLGLEQGDRVNIKRKRIADVCMLAHAHHGDSPPRLPGHLRTRYLRCNPDLASDVSFYLQKREI